MSWEHLPPKYAPSRPLYPPSPWISEVLFPSLKQPPVNCLVKREAMFFALFSTGNAVLHTFYH